MEIVKSIVVELRPLLGCCNVFITTTRLVVQDHLEITVRPDCIVITYSPFLEKSSQISCYDSTFGYESYSDSEDESYIYSKFMNMKPFCKMVPGSLCNLQFEANALSFRVLIKPLDSNCSDIFFNEVVNPNHSKLFQDTKSDECQVLNLEKNIYVKLVCSNCLNVISKGNGKNQDAVIFKRILQLPSDNLDMSDWFCHGVNNEHHHEEKSKGPNHSYFKPSSEDLFYGACFFFIDGSNLADSFIKFNSRKDLVHCNRCLSNLGSKQGFTFKFWNSCLKFHKAIEIGTECTNLNIFSYKHNPSASTDTNLALPDVLNFIKILMKESIIGLQMPGACRMILECEGMEKKSLLIWVLDRNLDMLRKVTLDDTSISESLKKEIIMSKISATKLLYNVLEEINVTDDWKDSSIQTATVSKEMFMSIIAHFVQNSALIPESSRRISGFHISYIFI